jgi:hypothetical protein
MYFETVDWAAEQLSLEPRVIKVNDYKKFLKDNETSTKKLMGW